MASKSWSTCSLVACLPFSKSPTIYQPYQLTKTSISTKQNLYFWIIMNISSYRLIGLCSNIIYDLFIFKRSYKDQNQNVGTRFISFCDHMNFFIVNWPIHRPKLLFFLHFICMYVSNRTIVQPFYDIIIYMIYSSLIQLLIAIKK